MSNIFNSVKETYIKSNTFDLTHDVKLSTKAGKLTPCCVIDTIPGDKFTISGNAMVRLAPTLAPIMHRMDVYIHYFFVPNRILWPGWEDFITGGQYGEDATVPPFLTVNTSQINNGDLLDYMGIPTGQDVGTGKTAKISALPLAAYQKIYQDYYRDENLIDETNFQLIDGDNTGSLGYLEYMRNRAWAKDYFTSALPWTQRGPEAILPLGQSAPIIPIDDGTGVQQYLRHTNGHAISNQTGNITWDASNTEIWDGAGDPSYISVEDSHEVDLSSATASTIIELRRAFALQAFLEANARGGSRYIENIAVHFGVQSSDKRLQRPEYIGGFSAPLKMSEVLQTSANASQPTPQGTMTGHGISVGGSKQYSYFCEEHGYIIGIMSVLPKPAYQQGIPRHFRRFDKFDYAWPAFANIGEQPIENIELWWAGNQTDEETFGYTPRYAEYKFQNNRVAGDFRTSLDFWHLGRKFANYPGLNEDFVTMWDYEIERVFAVQGAEDNLWCQVLNQVKAARKLPVFGTPKIQ